MTPNSVLAIIVVYHPDNKILEYNISLIAPQVEHVLIINNGPTCLNINNPHQEVSIINLLDNVGIAAALNIGMRHAIHNQIKYVLLLDQDSSPDRNMVERLLYGFYNEDFMLSVPRII